MTPAGNEAIAIPLIFSDIDSQSGWLMNDRTECTCIDAVTLLFEAACCHQRSHDIGARGWGYSGQIEIQVPRQQITIPYQPQQRARMKDNRQVLGKNQPLDLCQYLNLPAASAYPRCWRLRTHMERNMPRQAYRRSHAIGKA
ncbi:hypothetical protein IP70_13075 [alpha proteobacterium AAP38]|nr:hypothetical protein IP70_13075 [alpha proteobacterium AAP38]